MKKVLETAYKRSYSCCETCNEKMASKIQDAAIFEGVLVKNLPYLHCDTCGTNKYNKLIMFILKRVISRLPRTKVIDFNQLIKWF